MLSRAAFPIFEYDILYTGVVMGCQKSCIGIGKATWKLLPDHGNKGQMFSISPRFEAGNSCMKISSGICSFSMINSFVVDWWVRFSDVELHQGVRAHTLAPEHRVREGELKVPYCHGKLGWGNLARSKLTLKNWPAYIVAPAFPFLYSIRFYIGHGGAQWLDRHILSSC
jgi:hypothetical protein